MILRKLIGISVLACSLAFIFAGFTAKGSIRHGTIAATAQEEKTPHNFDAINYTIRTSFNRETKTVFGETTVTLKPLNDGFRTFFLEANNFEVESVVLEPNNVKLNFEVTPRRIKITLDKTYNASETILVRVKYKAKGKGVPNPLDGGGVFFIPAKGKTPAQIWTQGEPEDNRNWFPSYDFPDDKATSEQYLTVEKDEFAIGNGELLQIIENPDGTKTFHYKINVPHPTYLVSFVIGKFTEIKDKYENVPLSYFVYPGTEKIVPKAFGKTPKMFQLFERKTGIKYPFSTYRQVVVASFTFGGMENITSTTLLDSEIYAAENPILAKSTEDLVSHEIAHSWFGNLVTCKDWSELWLNEGFATFMEAIFKENEYGAQVYLQMMKENALLYFNEHDAGIRHPLKNLRAQPNALLFDSTTYKKGGFVLNMLRHELGDEAFWKAVNLYLQRHKFKTVETKDLHAAFEEGSGRDLDWFFGQWVYKAGYPTLKITPKYNAKTKTYAVTIAQTQTADSQTPEVFRFNTEIEIYSGKSKQTERIEVSKRIQTFEFKVSSKPDKLIFDPNERVLDKTKID